METQHTNAASLVREYLHLFLEKPPSGPVLDLACGDGRNGVFLACHGIPVVCCDKSAGNLALASRLAAEAGVSIRTWEVDLEVPGSEPLPRDAYGGMLVFRYLHRPLMPSIRDAVMDRGLLLYETFTVEQRRFGKPGNPDFLLKPGELLHWFRDWQVIHYFEGIQEDPSRAIARIVCRKQPATDVERS